jgi:riboflavin kinase/FMN adenylyltransferase
MTGTDGSARTAMTVVAGTAGLDRSLGRVFAVVGVFDGLHRGHEYLLGELRNAAAAHAARPMVITFDHHPDEILKGEAPPLLCDPEERLDRLAAAGVAITVVETFDRALRETPYDAWVRRIAERVELGGFLMTPESAFGYNRGGTPETVAALGRELGYEVTLVPQFTLEGQPVRSSDIRAAIAAGDLTTAERLLGRRVSLVGTVEWARREATVLGFPLPVALPAPGRYDAAVRTPAGAVRHREVAVDASGVRLAPALPALAGARVTVELLRPARPT